MSKKPSLWFVRFAIGTGVAPLLFVACSAGVAGSGGDAGDPIDSSTEIDSAMDDARLDGTTNEEAGVSMSGTYFAVCLPALAGGNLDQSLRFKATVVYVDAASPTISAQLRPMPAKSVKVSEAIAPTFPASPVASAVTNETFKWTFGTTPKLPASTNPLTGIDYSLTNFVAEGVVSKTSPNRFCAGISGATSPAGPTLMKSVDICIFQKVTSETTPMPLPSVTDFTCTAP